MSLYDKHQRRSIRLKGYDYSQPGAYFVTICAHNNESIFGHVINGNMHLNEFGKIVEKEWLKTFDMRKILKLDIYVIMPNHFHGIIIIADGRGTLKYAHEEKRQRRGTLQCADMETARCRGTLQRAHFDISQCEGTQQCAPTGEKFGKPVSNSIPTIIRLFKSATTKQINQIRQTTGMELWQHNYYEHIIRNENELNQVREYIINNPLQWQFDKENPNRRGKLQRAHAGTPQRAPTNIQWIDLEERIYNKMKQ
jgi:putative transposase